jgi:hypothetical protein
MTALPTASPDQLGADCPGRADGPVRRRRGRRRQPRHLVRGQPLCDEVTLPA